ncbi:EscU/YscU/HrcU family type III secretion system export apparatus switch protein [Kiloniella antarctica]|uniref:EscU/YscU/HrcU family type III secretion system export apparatus switch protein n=1 Tax=Kiloniella antarctica TaxID=1550907 RepID=A0ABW5BSQ3_9PROT
MTKKSSRNMTTTNTPSPEPDQYVSQVTPLDKETSKNTKLSIALKRSIAGKTSVTAKGSGELAEQILQIAFEKGVKVRTDADLAAVLSAVDVDSDIPIEALTAVATILNYVYTEQKQLNEETTPDHDIV